MKWFRFYSDALNNVKVQRLPPVLFKHWVNVLCVASEMEPRGSLPPVADLAFRMRIGEDEAERVVEQLITAGLLDRSEAGGLFPHDWLDHQRASDDVNIRVAKSRKKAAEEAAQQSSADGNVRVTLHVTPARKVRNVTRNTTDKIRGEEISPLEDLSGDERSAIHTKAAAPSLNAPDADRVLSSAVPTAVASSDNRGTLPPERPVVSPIAGPPIPLQPGTSRGQQLARVPTEHAVNGYGQTPPLSSAPPPPVPVAPAEEPEVAGARRKPVNPIWDELVRQFEHEPESKDERNRWGRRVKELKELGATPEEIAERCRKHRAAGLYWELTVNSLVTHWGELGQLSLERLAANGHRGNGSAAAAMAAQQQDGPAYRVVRPRALGTGPPPGIGRTISEAVEA